MTKYIANLEILKIGWLNVFMLDMGFEPNKSKCMNYISDMVVKMGVASISELKIIIHRLWSKRIYVKT